MTSDWIDARAAARMLGLGVYQVHRLSLLGRIRHHKTKNDYLRFNREDCQRIADKGERPAPTALEMSRTV
jgi:hypothetical protein